MSTGPQQARVTVSVHVPPAVAFAVFTEEIDLWWKQGPQFRNSGRFPGTLQLELKLGGRLFETRADKPGTPAVEVGVVTAWQPPSRLVLEWRNATFGPHERTEVEVSFEPTEHGTQVTVVHRGWEKIRADHPVRHGLERDAFVRGLGLWWGEQMTSLRERAEAQALPR